MNTKIKESNYWAIHDFANLNQWERITGTKLQALYTLIQKKGEPMQTEEEGLNGVKVLEYAEGQYVGLIRTGFKRCGFFPCKMKCISLTNL